MRLGTSPPKRSTTPGRHADQALRLVPVEAGRADDVLDLERLGDGEVLRRRVAGEQVRASPCSPARRCTGPTGSWRRAARRGCGGRARTARAPCPGTRRLSRSRVRRARPAGVRGRRSVRGRGRRRPSGGEGIHRYRGSDAPPRDRSATPGRRTSTAIPTGWSIDVGRRAGRRPTPTSAAARRPRRGGRRGRRAGAAVGARAATRAVADGGRCARASARSARCTSSVARCRSTSRGRSTCARSCVGQDEEAWLDGEQPGVRLAPRAGRLDPRGPRRSGWRSRGSTRPASCCTRRTAGSLGFCWTKEHRDERPAARRDLRDRRRPRRRRQGPRPAADPGRPRPPPPAGARPSACSTSTAATPRRWRSTTGSASPSTTPTWRGPSRCAAA